MHIYRLVTEHTIEENILRKSDQKRALDHLAIQSGGFNTEFLQRFNPRELLGLNGVLLCKSRHDNSTHDHVCASEPYAWTNRAVRACLAASTVGIAYAVAQIGAWLSVLIRLFTCAGTATPAAVSEEEMQAAMRGAEDDADAAAAAALEKEEANEAAEFNAEVRHFLHTADFQP